MSTSCPWSAYEPAQLVFCEERLCAWVAEPSNAWSNVAFLLLGAGLLASRERRRSTLTWAMAALAVLLGVGSFAFHASATMVGEQIDLMSMYFLSTFALVMNAARLWGISRSGQLALWVFLNAGSLALLLWAPKAELLVFGVQAVGAVGLELWLRSTSTKGPSYRPLAQLGVVFGVAWGIWWLDFLRLACVPQNHWVTGHAVWHVLNAVGVLCLYRFYAQLPAAATTVPVRGELLET